MSCNQCGDCCRLVAIRQSRADLLAALPELALNATWPHVPEDRAEDQRVWHDRCEDAAFILAHWSEVHPFVARVLWPEFTTGYDPEVYTFYACDQFDERTALCRAHAHRPPVCRNFPWYDQEPDPGRIHRAFTRCGYRQEAP